MENDRKMTIREWSEEDRPREKMLLKGVGSLSDAELLAILIGTGSRNESAVELSRRILALGQYNLNELARMTVNDLCKGFRGIGQAKAISILAAMELGKRRNKKEVIERRKISSSQDLFDLISPDLTDLPHEEFWAIMMNTGNFVLEARRLTQGGVNQTVVDVSMLLKLALEKSAFCLAVAHNHPSGNNKPSREDEMITKRIKSGCEAVGIRFLDHIIIAREKYYSFCDENKL